MTQMTFAAARFCSVCPSARVQTLLDSWKEVIAHGECDAAKLTAEQLYFTMEVYQNMLSESSERRQERSKASAACSLVLKGGWEGKGALTLQACVFCLAA